MVSLPWQFPALQSSGGRKLTCGDLTEANPEFGCHPTRSKAGTTGPLCIPKILVATSEQIFKCHCDHWLLSLLPTGFIGYAYFKMEHPLIRLVVVGFCAGHLQWQDKLSKWGETLRRACVLGWGAELHPRRETCSYNNGKEKKIGTSAEEGNGQLTYTKRIN